MTGDNPAAVARGLAQAGRLVSAPAVLFVLVSIAFVSSWATFIKLFGLGMALAVIVDATLVRLHARLGSTEAAPYHGAPATVPATVPAGAHR